MEEIYTNIYRESRKKAGLEQSEAADMIGVSYHSLAKYEKKINPLIPPDDVVRNMVIAYNDRSLAYKHIKASPLGEFLPNFECSKDLSIATLTFLSDFNTIEGKDHTLDTVTLSSIAGRVIGKLSTLESRLTELDAQALHDRTKVNEIKQDLDTTVLHVSESWASSVNESLFTQTAQGLFLEVNKVVGTNRWSTLLQQSATDVKIAWNNISKYIQFESGELRIYDSEVAESQKLRAKFNESGNHFYRDDYYVGKIGTNYWGQYKLINTKPTDWDTSYSRYYVKHNNSYNHVSSGSAPTFTTNTYYEYDTSHKGLVFDLDSQGKYMAFAQTTSDNDYYTTMLCFSRANSIYSEYGLHLGCNLYGHGVTIKDIYLDGVSVKDGGTNRTGYSGAVPIITAITSPTVSSSINNVQRNSDDAITSFEISVNVQVNYNTSNLRVVNGIVVGYWN